MPDPAALAKCDELEERFQKHVATETIFAPLGGNTPIIHKIDWGLPNGSSIDRITYLIHHNFLYVSGDLGEAIYEWPSTISLEWLAGLSLDYFGGKCRASSEEPRGKCWDEDRVKRFIEEKLKEWAEENYIPCPTCSDPDFEPETDPDDPGEQLPCPTCNGETEVPPTPITFEHCQELMYDEDIERLEDVISHPQSWGRFISDGMGLILSDQKIPKPGRKLSNYEHGFDYPRFEFDSEYYDIGYTWDLRTRMHLKGLKMAWAQLKETSNV